MCALLLQWAQIAPGLTPLVAGAAVWVAWRQLRLNRKNQSETTAKGIWREYLKLAFEYPHFAWGRNDINREDHRQYEWFVAYLLWASEEILAFDPSWENNIEVNLGYHRYYFKNDPNFMKAEFPLYNAKVQGLVRRVMAEAT